MVQVQMSRLAVKVQGRSVEVQGMTVDSLIALGKAVSHHQLMWLDPDR